MEIASNLKTSSLNLTRSLWLENHAFKSYYKHTVETAVFSSIFHQGHAPAKHFKIDCGGSLKPYAIRRMEIRQNTHYNILSWSFSNY